jgi:hypothetical protein
MPTGDARPTKRSLAEDVRAAASRNDSTRARRLDARADELAAMQQRLKDEAAERRAKRESAR